MKKQIVLRVKMPDYSDEDIDFKELNEKLADGWTIEFATPISKACFKSGSCTDSIIYVLEKKC